MKERFEDYFEKLEKLSVEELDHSARKLVRVERQNVALVVAHLAEMGEKKGHVELGFDSLFEYGVRRLKLSGGSVYRRLQVAGKSREFPELLDGLFQNRFTLTVASILAPHLTAENVDTLLSQAEGMSRREAEEVAVRLRPKEEFKSSRRKVRSAKGEAQTPAAEGLPGVSEPAQTARDAGEAEKPEPRTVDPQAFALLLVGLTRASDRGPLQLSLLSGEGVHEEARDVCGSDRSQVPS